MNIDHAILFNRCAQGVVSISDLIDFVHSLSSSEREHFLSGLITCVDQARPMAEDGHAAVQASGLSITRTPCVMVSKNVSHHQLRRMADLLDRRDFDEALSLLVHLYAIADRRRREVECSGNKPERHWWHLDLSNEDVIRWVRHQYNKGEL
jgi:hypothetical protein